jgi:hypothetical protein
MNLTGKHYGIILFALVTAILHITLFPDIMFTLNGLGYLGLLGAYFLPISFFQQRHKLVWWALVSSAYDPPGSSWARRIFLPVPAA